MHHLSLGQAISHTSATLSLSEPVRYSLQVENCGRTEQNDLRFALVRHGNNLFVSLSLGLVRLDKLEEVTMGPRGQCVRFRGADEV